MESFIVGYIAFEVADRDGLLLETKGIDALALTLLLLGAYTSTDGRERTGLTDYI
jgi:hypothetical protein